MRVVPIFIIVVISTGFLAGPADRMLTSAYADERVLIEASVLGGVIFWAAVMLALGVRQEDFLSCSLEDLKAISPSDWVNFGLLAALLVAMTLRSTKSLPQGRSSAGYYTQHVLLPSNMPLQSGAGKHDLHHTTVTTPVDKSPESELKGLEARLQDSFWNRDGVEAQEQDEVSPTTESTNAPAEIPLRDGTAQAADYQWGGEFHEPCSVRVEDKTVCGDGSIFTNSSESNHTTPPK